VDTRSKASTLAAAAALGAVCLGLAPSALGAGPSAQPLLYPYFGDLHAHTSYSDGARGSTPAVAFAAGAAAGADFMATTDHQGSLTTAEWLDTMAAAASATTDTFVALPGYEAWVTGVGEINVFGTAAWPAYPVGKGADKANSGHHGNRWDALPAFYDWLAAEPGAVGQWNHPTAYAGQSSEDFVGYAYRTDDRDAGMGLIEVFNDVVYEASYTRALDAGWHVMPAANSDTHAADWISGSEVRTVLLAPALTPEDLYAAMQASRGYATLDRNLRIGLQVNGEPMGTVLGGSTTTFTIEVWADDPDGTTEDEITAIEIVGDGGLVVASATTAGTSVDWTATVDAAAVHYLYARITTASGAGGAPGPTAWTAPVWTGLPYASP
jgi:hypothetical protein